MKQWVLLSRTDGLFIGHGMGMIFFSKSEDAGQRTVVTFPTEESAIEFALEYMSACGPLETAPVEAINMGQVSIPELIACGYREHLGLLLANIPQHSTIQ